MSMNDPEKFMKQTGLKNKAIAKELLDQVKDKLCWNKTEMVLDIGCGPGNITATLLHDYVPENSTIVGGDISKDMINYAKLNYSTKDVSFKFMDICDNLSISNNEKYSKIFSFYCFHRLDNFRKAMENVYNLLTPGGEFFISLESGTSWKNLLSYAAILPKFAYYKKKLLSMAELNFNTDAEVVARSIGFQVKYKSLKNQKYEFETLDEAFGFLESISFLPRNSILETLEDIRDNIDEMEILEKTDDGYNFNHTTLSFLAIKPKK